MDPRVVTALLAAAAAVTVEVLEVMVTQGPGRVLSHQLAFDIDRNSSCARGANMPNPVNICIGDLFNRSSDSPMDWDSLKIIDYISMMEEMWRKLDVHDTNCQKRILCEIHQNEKALGPAASKIVNAFGYADNN